MAADQDPYLPFSQRTGLVEVPPQLKIGEISSKIRRELCYHLSLEIDSNTRYGVSYSYLSEIWSRVASDFHVLFLNRPISSYKPSITTTRADMEEIFVKSEVGRLFDFVEFLTRHKNVSARMKSELSGVLVSNRAAYRIFDGLVVAVGNDHQAVAFARAIDDAAVVGALAVRKQLLAAAVAVRNGHWADSVRESIHAVEAMAVQLAPGTDTLGPALRVIEGEGHLHGSLKAAFGSLYGYSSDEGGIRHALVFGDEAQVDEADAMFMLGACASFVSYLIARSTRA